MPLVTLPYELTANTTASASEVMGNFNALEDAINGNIESVNLADGSVSAGKIQSNAVTDTKINTAAVTEAKIASGAVTADKIGTGAVTEAKLGDASVTEAKIGSGAVTADKIGAAAVTEAKIGSGAVTADKLGSGSVTNPKLGTGAVEADNIAADAVTTAKILDENVTPAKTSFFAGMAIYAGSFEVAASAISASNLPSGWNVTRNFAGNYTVTHSLGLDAGTYKTDIAIMLTTGGTATRPSVTVSDQAQNSFEISVEDDSAGATDPTHVDFVVVQL